MILNFVDDNQNPIKANLRIDNVYCYTNRKKHINNIKRASNIV
jgi:hypothetical protein